MKPGRSHLPPSRTTAPSQSVSHGLAPPKNPFIPPGTQSTRPIPATESSPEDGATNQPNPTNPPLRVVPVNRWPARRRQLRMRVARFFRTTSPVRVMVLYLGLLGIVVLTLVLVLAGPRPQTGAGSGDRSSSPQPTAEEQYRSLGRQTARFIREKKLAEAEANLAVMQTLQPKDPTILSHAGAIATQRKDYDQARKLYQAVLNEKPGDYVAAYNLAEIAFVTRDFPEAERRFHRLAQTRAHDDNLLFRLFLCALLQDRPGEAEEISRQLSRAGATPAWYYASAILARRAGKIRPADEWLGQARILYPDKAKFYDATCQSLGLLQAAAPSSN